MTCGVPFCTVAATHMWFWSSSNVHYPVCAEHGRQKARGRAPGQLRPLATP